MENSTKGRNIDVQTFSKKSTCPKSVALLNQARPLSASQNRLLLSSSGAHGGTRPPVLEMPGQKEKIGFLICFFAILKFHVMHYLVYHRALRS